MKVDIMLFVPVYCLMAKWTHWKTFNFCRQRENL